MIINATSLLVFKNCYFLRYILLHVGHVTSCKSTLFHWLAKFFIRRDFLSNRIFSWFMYVQNVFFASSLFSRGSRKVHIHKSPTQGFGKGSKKETWGRTFFFHKTLCTWSSSTFGIVLIIADIGRILPGWKSYSVSEIFNKKCNFKPNLERRANNNNNFCG